MKTQWELWKEINDNDMYPQEYWEGVWVSGEDLIENWTFIDEDGERIIDFYKVYEFFEEIHGLNMKRIDIVEEPGKEFNKINKKLNEITRVLKELKGDKE